MESESPAAANERAPVVLEVSDLEITFPTDDGPLRAVDGLSFRLRAGQTLGLVGESGCGKTVTALAALGLVPPPGRITGGRVGLESRDLVGLDEAAMEDVRGNRIGMIFQEPMTALNPVFTVGEQIAEALRIHGRATGAAAAAGAADLLDRVGVPDPARRASAYPHQLSGGMRQRAMIAMALACDPDILVADEPTTALDVTIQAQILDLILEMQRDRGLSMLFISHDLAVVSEVADEVLVMYAGRAVEQASAETLFRDPRHPYTQGLLETLPRADRRIERLPAIPGTVPDLRRLPEGCRFSDRCPRVVDDCRRAEPALRAVGREHYAACIRS